MIAFVVIIMCRPQTTRLKVREKPARTAAQPSVIRRSTSGIARNNLKSALLEAMAVDTPKLCG